MNIYDIYTDGAASKNGKEGAIGGWAYIIIKNKKQIIDKESGRVDGATNNQMELSAAIYGLNRLVGEGITGFDKVNVYTDSAYLYRCYSERWYINWIRNGWSNASKDPVKNQDLWVKLIQYFDNPMVTFHKVRAHTGLNDYNDMVDKMAVEARKNG